MSLRGKWTVRLATTEVLDHANARARHHLKRKADWEVEQRQAESELKEKGLEFREMAMTGGNRVEAILDPQRQARLQECRSKVEQHGRKADEYHSFARALMVMANNNVPEVELDAEDIGYFDL